MKVGKGLATPLAGISPTGLLQIGIQNPSVVFCSYRNQAKNHTTYGAACGVAPLKPAQRRSSPLDAACYLRYG
jgi:hypothetical protein